MERRISFFLDQWIADPHRKPMVLRGARQVGKTWLVRDLAQRHKLALVEINMERRPELAEHFRSNDARRAIAELAIDLNLNIFGKESILFIDEIQATPHLLAFLRWFKEDLPDLPVIAAGSLLDFALQEPEFTMPVGRISYGYVEPLSFYEFLDASGNAGLRAALFEAAGTMELSSRLHQRALELFSEYCLVGGLPEVAADWLSVKNDERRLQLQRDLIATYRDDFNKYRNRLPADTLRQVMDSLPRQMGKRFVYSHVGIDAGQREIKRCFELLCMARVCHRIERTAANALPLGAEINPSLFKTLLVDIGLASVQLGLSRVDMRQVHEVVWANSGGMAEQFVGQQLRCVSSAFEDPRLFYWQRTEGRQAEIDYLIQDGSRMLPIEVKAGTAGSMKSLHLFMHQKKLSTAVRLDMNPPSVQDLRVKTTTGDAASYRLVSLPLYMAESVLISVHRIAAGDAFY